MSSFKKLNKADVTTVPYAANKQWSFSYGGTEPNDSNMIYYWGYNEPFSTNGNTTYGGQYQSLVYNEINHLFYQSYSSSLLDTGSLMFNVDTYQSASQQRPTGSYFNYNTNPLLIKQFPTGFHETIGVLSVNQEIYGSKILPNSFQISASGVFIKDDGNGNLYDVAGALDQYVDLNWVTLNYFAGNAITGIVFVGNIFYAYGICVFTPFDANLWDINPTTVSFQNEHIIYENEVRCIIKESEYNLTYNPTILQYGGQYIISGSSGYTLTGSLDYTVKDFTTGSFFHPYATTIGLYNDDNELLMVAKLGKPIMISPDTDMCFVVKYDI